MPTTMEKLPLGYTEGKGNETAGTEAALKLKKPRLYLKLLDEERDLEDYHAIWSNDKATYWT